MPAQFLTQTEDVLSAVNFYARHGGLSWGQTAGFARQLNEALPLWSRESCYRAVFAEAREASWSVMAGWSL